MDFGAKFNSGINYNEQIQDRVLLSSQAYQHKQCGQTLRGRAEWSTSCPKNNLLSKTNTNFDGMESEVLARKNFNHYVSRRYPNTGLVMSKVALYHKLVEDMLTFPIEERLVFLERNLQLRLPECKYEPIQDRIIQTHNRSFAGAGSFCSSNMNESELFSRPPRNYQPDYYRSEPCFAVKQPDVTALNRNDVLISSPKYVDNVTSGRYRDILKVPRSIDGNFQSCEETGLQGNKSKDIVNFEQSYKHCLDRINFGRNNLYVTELDSTRNISNENNLFKSYLSIAHDIDQENIDNNNQEYAEKASQDVRYVDVQQSIDKSFAVLSKLLEWIKTYKQKKRAEKRKICMFGGVNLLHRSPEVPDIPACVKRESGPSLFDIHYRFFQNTRTQNQLKLQNLRSDVMAELEKFQDDLKEAVILRNNITKIIYASFSREDDMIENHRHLQILARVCFRILATVLGRVINLRQCTQDYIGMRIKNDDHLLTFLKHNFPDFQKRWKDMSGCNLSAEVASRRPPRMY